MGRRMGSRGRSGRLRADRPQLSVRSFRLTQPVRVGLVLRQTRHGGQARSRRLSPGIFEAALWLTAKRKRLDPFATLERDDFSILIRRALAFCLSLVLSEQRRPL